MEDGQKCLKLYTNPEFFIDEWIAEQKRQQDEAKQKRRERREARLKRKQEKGGTDTTVAPKKVGRIRKVKYLFLYFFCLFPYWFLFSRSSLLFSILAPRCFLDSSSLSAHCEHWKRFDSRTG